MTPALSSAIIHKQSWQSVKLDAYARALLKAALDLWRFRRVVYFNNDDVPAGRAVSCTEY